MNVQAGLSTEDKRLIQRTRRFLKADLGRANLMDCAPSSSVRKDITATQVLYHVTEKDCAVTFEQTGHSRGHFKLLFVKLTPLTPAPPVSLDSIARQFMLDMLQREGFKAVAQHRYGANASAILEAAKRLVERSL